MGSCAFVNEERLFKNVGRFFKADQSVFEELVENSQRAGAGKILIKREGNTLFYKDDGEGIGDFYALLSIGESRYGSGEVEFQNPAGMGFLQLLSMAEEVIVKSRGKMLAINSNSFFNDKIYRSSLLENIKNSDIKKGVDIHAKFVENVDLESLFICLLGDIELGKYSYYRPDIEVDTGKKIIMIPKADPGKDSIAVKEYKGAKIYLNRGAGKVYWFGKPIDCYTLRPFHIEIWDRCDFLKPKLPDRKGLANSLSELERLKRELEDLFKEEIVEYIRNSDPFDAISLLRKLDGDYSEYVEFWEAEVSESVIDMLVKKDEVDSGAKNPIENRDIEIEIDGKEKATAYIDINFRNEGFWDRNLNEFFEPVSFIGGTSMPNWIKERIKKPKVEIRTHGKNYKGFVGDWTVSLVKSIDIKFGEKIVKLPEIHLCDVCSSSPDMFFGNVLFFSDFKNVTEPRFAEEFDPDDYDYFFSQEISAIKNRFELKPDFSSIKAFLRNVQINPEEVDEICIKSLEDRNIEIRLKNGEVLSF